MKRKLLIILILFIFMFIGCSEPEPIVFKFQKGDICKHLICDKPGIVIDQHYYYNQNMYTVKFHNPHNDGVPFHIEYCYEYELEKYEE